MSTTTEVSLSASNATERDPATNLLYAMLAALDANDGDALANVAEAARLLPSGARLSTTTTEETP